MFKEGVVDPSNRLSSWSSLQDCCQWKGVLCDDNNRIFYIDLSSDNHSESFRGEINLSSLLALQFLESLYLVSNDFERISMPSTNNTHWFTNSSRLSSLSLSDNIHLHIDNLHYWLSLLPSLSYLNLSGIHLPSETNLGQSLALLPLETLDLHDCNLTTSSILSPEYANFSSLSSLDLGLNDLRYGLPHWLFNLSKELSYVSLSQCNLRGQIPDFSGYRDLGSLYLSNNKFRGSIPLWLGQLNILNELDLSNNLFNGSIPSNLVNASSLTSLNISFNDLSGTLPENLVQGFFSLLDLSHNSISGDISSLLLQSNNIFLSFNKFKGQLPRVSSRVHALDLAYNSFSGPLSSLLCFSETDQSGLEYLELSKNNLTQGLPGCWNNWTSLSYIYLGNNQLVGQVPSTMGSSLNNLKALDLHNNGFFGDIPWTFHNFTSLVLLNLAGNNFSGRIQTWMPQSVIVLKLRSNQFIGSIPSHLCSLSILTVLDLANNKFSGPIPHCLHNTAASLDMKILENILSPGLYIMAASDKYMKIDLHTKGQPLEYDKNLKLVRSIDLSDNKLSGEIPIQLFNLTKLQFLNLSHNNLIGKISEQIGEMTNLESLDFSHNNLHGNIPQSMSGLSFLSVLDLSYNHFSGQIPLGTQLQSFDAQSYTGNPELCGPPLQKNCTLQEKPDNTKQVEGNGDDVFLKSMYLGMGVGFAVGFWVVCGSLFLNRKWRHAYFRFFDRVVDRIYVAIVIKLRRFC
ncbi:hypothetical protein K1719_027572 [Acacia pycnantha]|nr:hypothetical protein K1719_027572 [Acacia pycnantha]